LRNVHPVVALLLASLGLAACGEPLAQPRVCDAAGLLAPEHREVLALQSVLTARESGADLAWVIERRVPGGLEAASAALVDRLRVGPMGRGLLVVYDVEAGRLRLEVGYALEALLPDAMVSRWIDGHLRPLFESGRPDIALLLATRMIRDRLRASALRDDSPLPPMPALAYGSGGGGASRPARLRVRESLPMAGMSSRGQRLAFLPAPSVREAHARYLGWLADGRFDTEAMLFTAASRAFLSGWPMTPGYLRHIYSTERGRRFVVLQRAAAALLVCVDDPHVAPHFFVRGPEGWQMDLATEAQEVVNLVGGAWSWAFRDPGAPSLAPFADSLVDLGGFVRLREGDNRVAPQARVGASQAAATLQAGCPRAS